MVRMSKEAKAEKSKLSVVSQPPVNYVPARLPEDEPQRSSLEVGGSLSSSLGQLAGSVQSTISNIFAPSKEKREEEDPGELPPERQKVKKVETGSRYKTEALGLRQRKALQPESPSSRSPSHGSDASRASRSSAQKSSPPAGPEKNSLPLNTWPKSSREGKEPTKPRETKKAVKSKSSQPRGEAPSALKDLGPEGIQACQKALEEGKQRQGCVKLCFVGHARAGKTSTLLALAERPFDEQQPSTHGVDTCVLQNELLEISQKPNQVDGTPWGVLEGRSVQEMLERGVAKGVAQELKGRRRGAWQDKEKRPASGKEAPPPASAHETLSEHDVQEVLKMPVDLVAKAVKSGQEDPDQVILQTWDFAGQEMFYSMAHVFITSPGIYVLVVNLAAWLDAVAAPEPMCSCGLPLELSDSLDFWLAAVLVHAPDARLIIVGSHDDMIPSKLSSVVRERVNNYLMQRLDNPAFHSRLHVNEEEQLLFFPVDNSRSTDAGRGVARLRRALDQLALEAAEEAGWIPTRWAQFFSVLTSRRSAEAEAKRMHYVTLEELKELAQRFGIMGTELDSFLALFHGLGQLLYFRGSPGVVLEPQWLLDAMAQVVGCPRVLQRHSHDTAALWQRGELSAKLLSSLWSTERSPQATSGGIFQRLRMVAKSERDEETLRAFLEHFGLLVPVPSTGLSGARSWLVPSLLPKRNHPAAGPAEALGKASLFFDFHGALRQLLPSLLPRLFAELQKSEDLSSQVKMVCQDYLAFSMKSAGQPIFVTLELVSEPREMLQLTVTDAQHPEVGHLIMSETFQVISLGFNTCVPKLSFTAKVPCPLCCHADSSGAPKHLLDIDVLSELQLFCSHSQKVFSERSLPAYLQAWRAEQLREPVAPLPAGVKSLPELGNEPGVFQLNFLYASPLLCGSQPLQALDIMSEVQALQGVAGISPDVDVATFANLQERLLRPLKGPTVLHLSAHVATAACALTATHVTKPQLLLEDPRGLAHPLSEEALASMASWKAAEYQPSTASWLLVFLACGSERLVQHLMRTAGLREAICCRGQVFDSAARVFCKAFYQALAARCDVAESHQVAQAAVRNSASLGLQGEADKFLYLRSGAEPLPRPAAEGLGNVAKWPSWRPWPRVEDYAVCRLLDSCRIAAAFQSDASHRRRVVQILGDMGMGKSAMCREFCGYFSSPGRMFANRAFLVDEASFKSFQANGNDEELVARAILQTLEQPGSESVVQLPAFAKTMDLAGPWLLAIDGLSEMPHLCPAIVKILDSLLSQTSSLKLLLTSRKRVSLRPSGTGYSGFAASKAVELSLQPLPPQSAAELFRQRAHREFCTADFDALAKAVPAEALQILQHGPTLLERLAASPLLHALGGIPGRIVEAADRVDSSLASLLQHPMVPSEWTQHSGGDLPALEPSP